MKAPIIRLKIAALTVCCALVHAGAAGQALSPRDEAVGIQGMLGPTHTEGQDDAEADSDEYPVSGRDHEL